MQEIVAFSSFYRLTYRKRSAPGVRLIIVNTNRVLEREHEISRNRHNCALSGKTKACNNSNKLDSCVLFSNNQISDYLVQRPPL